MTQIAAANNRAIEIETSRWILRDATDPDTLAVAQADGLTYESDFGRVRRLPPEGLAREDIAQIVLGYQASDETWRLGLILAPELASQRGSRWCELVHWPDPDRNVFIDLAHQAGRGLAHVLDVPFYSVPPQPRKPLTPPPPLPELPLQFGLWSMQREGKQLVLARSRRWSLNKTGRILWLTFWLIVYIAVSIATLTSDLALPNAGTLLPNPQWLPYLGLATAIVLVGIIGYHIVRLTASYNRIVIDPQAGTISAWRGQRQYWQRQRDDVQSVYISEIVKRRKADPAAEHGEINLHLGGGKFQFVVQQAEAEANNNARLPINKEDRRKSNVQPLTRETVSTDLQAAALHIAAALGDLPTWYDMRVK